MFDNIRKQLSRLIGTTRNAISLPQQFLKYGSGYMNPDWTQVVMTDNDLYTGYGYAAIRNRSNTVAKIAVEDVKTDSEKDDFTHSYLDIISSSKTFSNYAFWHNISTYLDLEGVYYLMVVRAAEGERIGKPLEFKLLNPYNIRRVKKSDAPDVVEGYVEAKGGFVRDIPKDMIIEIRELNPFDPDKPYSMTDAANEAQFTLKTAGDYTRNALRHNVQAPGILSTDVALEEEDFKNFIARVKAHKKGEPIFGNGSGAVTYENMQNELSKAALRDINEINRDALFATTGVSKTIMGIEQSGTTRETAKVQKDLLIEGHILPRIQLIIDALNQDYKNNYPKEYETNKALIIVDNPLAVDHDSDKKDTEVKTSQFDLYTSLINKGYDADLAGRYVTGEITVDDLGEPKNPPVNPIVEAQEKLKETEEKLAQVVKNQLEEKRGLVQQQQGYLQNAVVNIEEQAAAIVIDKVSKKKVEKNSIEDYGTLFDSEDKLITQREKNELENELEAVLVGFYGIIMTLEGGQIMRDRVGQYALKGDFSLDKDIRKYIKATSQKVSESHIDTVSKELYETARKAALEGQSQQQIISTLKTRYADIAEERAKVVARTETNRAFTRAQFDADRQFTEQNDLEGRVFKQWRTRSDNPCEFCLALEAEPPRPLNKNFRDLGDTITVGKGKGKKTMDVSFESLEAGNAHPNCSCTYELIIKPAKKK